MTQDNEETLAREQHIRYFKYHLHILPSLFAKLDTIRMTVAFFVLSGLDLLGTIDELKEEDKKAICDWIYLMQVSPIQSGDDITRIGGFQGSTTHNVATRVNTSSDKCCSDYSEYACGHLAMTYTALSCLVILGDDLARLDRPAIAQAVRALQQPDGSFAATCNSESDMRFVYCAACVCHMIKDWSGMDKDRTVDFILKSMSYDYGFGQGPDMESHGGSTYCALATLFLMDRVDDSLSSEQLKGLKKWALMRQCSGFQGRPNKAVDTCYSFWIGATLKLLDAFHLANATENRAYVLSTQDSIVGGFGKYVDTSPDPMHSYLGLSGLSILGESGIEEIDPKLNISVRAIQHLEQIQKTWDEK